MSPTQSLNEIFPSFSLTGVLIESNLNLKKFHPPLHVKLIVKIDNSQRGRGGFEGKVFMVWSFLDPNELGFKLCLFSVKTT